VYPNSQSPSRSLGLSLKVAGPTLLVPVTYRQHRWLSVATFIASTAADLIRAGPGRANHDDILNRGVLGL
jgi:hypothetical protein